MTFCVDISQQGSDMDYCYCCSMEKKNHVNVIFYLFSTKLEFLSTFFSHSSLDPQGSWFLCSSVTKIYSVVNCKNIYI